ncbi:MAG: glycosyltransferase [Clostridia bacterium]
MKVLFCYSGPIFLDQIGQLFGTHLTDDIFQRYFLLGEELVLAVSVEKIQDSKSQNKFTKISSSPIQLVELSKLNTFRKMLFEKSEAKKKLEEAIQQADLVIIRLPCMLGNMAVDIAEKLKKPFLLEIVGCPWDSYRYHSLKGKLIAPLAYFAMYRRVLHAPFSMYVTEEFLQKRYPTKGIHCGCSDVHLEVVNESILVSRIEKINKRKFNERLIIGTIGATNVKYKGQQYIIKALSKLRADGVEDYKYLVIGPGNTGYLTKIAQKYNVSDLVEFVGVIPHNEIFKILDKIDIYAQPSRTEGLPRALIEAMSRGVPSFGCRVGGMPELLESKMLFSKSHNCVKEICLILKSLTKDLMIHQARRNYLFSQNYQHDLLDNKRNQFLLDFKNSFLLKK